MSRASRLPLTHVALFQVFFFFLGGRSLFYDFSERVVMVYVEFFAMNLCMGNDLKNSC